MGFFDDIVLPDSAPSYVATPPGVPRITVRPSFETGAARPPQDEGVELPPRTAGLFDNVVAPAAQHKAALERALSTTVPLRLQHPGPIEIAAGLMADHGMPLDEALDRATMRLHAEEGTAEAGKINDVIGKDAFDEAQRAPASPDLAQPATGVGQGGTATKEQARPDGEHASGDSAPQGGDAAGEKTIGSEGAGPTDNRAQSSDEVISAAAKGEGGDQGPASDMPASGGGQFAAPLPDGRNFRIVREGISSPAAPEGFRANAADFAKSVPHGLVSGISSALSATGAAANAEMSQPEDYNPTPQETQKALEENVTGATHKPEGSAGKFGAAIGEALGNPSSYLSPGGLPLKVGTAVLGAIGGEAGRQAAEGTPYEMPAQLAGGLAGGAAAVKTFGAPRPIGITPRWTNPRAGPQPPARPPDKAAAQSDWTNSGARESGPSSLGGKEQDALRSEGASAAPNSVPTAAAAESGPKLIGSFTPRADLKYGGTDFGNHAHREIGSMLRKLYRDADLILRVEPGQRGIDVSVPAKHIARLGFAHAEIKPLSESGEKKLRQQVGKWGYDPSTVRAITYDANGNVYFGFR